MVIFLTNEDKEVIDKELDKISKDISDIKQSSTGAVGISLTAINLLMTILRSCSTYSDQTANIDALEVALKNGAPSDEEQNEGVTQTGSILYISNGVTATQSGSMLALV